MEQKTTFGFRYGHFYSKRLMNDILGVEGNGLVRVSMVHYNTVHEIQELVKALDDEIGA